MKESVKKFVKQFIGWIRKQLREKFHLRNENAPYYIAIATGLMLLTLTTYWFVQITGSLMEGEVDSYDEAITEFILAFRSPGLTSFFSACTHLGDRAIYITIIVCLTVFFWIKFKNWQFTSQIIFVLVIASLSSMAIKRVIDRDRPAIDGHLVEVYSQSFPSGHSMSAMAFYGLLIYLCVRYKIAATLRVVLVCILTVIIFLVGLSRIYLGVHYPSDVAAGYLGGLIWVSFGILLFNTLELWRKLKKKGGIEPAKASD
jgi:membrane-associated phospholipid phosphatase